MPDKEQQRPPLEEGLLQAMQALDNQIERETSRRTPAQLEEHGVQKWEPFDKRVERICSFILNALGDTEIRLDSILVLAQAMTKSLQLAVEDLGEEGLGQVRTNYCVGVMTNIARDADVVLKLLKKQENLIS